MWLPVVGDGLDLHPIHRDGQRRRADLLARLGITVASQHGPPAKSLGWAIPFGYPWTHPQDEGLEAALYDEMAEKWGWWEFAPTAIPRKHYGRW